MYVVFYLPTSSLAHDVTTGYTIDHPASHRHRCSLGAGIYAVAIGWALSLLFVKQNACLLSSGHVSSISYCAGAGFSYPIKRTKTLPLRRLLGDSLSPCGTGITAVRGAGRFPSGTKEGVEVPKNEAESHPTTTNERKGKKIEKSKRKER
ncbi:hypothetical protein CPC08DRAFT_726681 [Agrocybe pediades]|nr:hypothetical protein CPC08DRAFT_726681 [Agrocybe pediades]